MVRRWRLELVVEVVDGFLACGESCWRLELVVRVDGGGESWWRELVARAGGERWWRRLELVARCCGGLSR